MENQLDDGTGDTLELGAAELCKRDSKHESRPAFRIRMVVDTFV
jgi:hypothetical protein